MSRTFRIKKILLYLFIMVMLIFGLSSASSINEMRGISIKSQVVEKEVRCLALNIYHESRGETSGIGRLAVGLVTLNRKYHSYFPNLICQVVKQGNIKSKAPARLGSRACQFSWFCDGKSDKPKSRIDWNDSYKIAMMLYLLEDHNIFDVTEGSTHYHNKRIKPKWVKDKNMHFVKQTGNHRFYRWEPKQWR